MAETIYMVQNAALPTTAITVPVATGTAIKTMLQGTATSTKQIEIVAWGISFDGSPEGTVELIHTTTVAGTGSTAVTPTVWSNPNDNAAASTWGFSPSAEGTVAATVRLLDLETVKTNTYVMWFPLYERPVVPASGVVRVRLDMITGANANCWILFKES